MRAHRRLCLFGRRARARAPPTSPGTGRAMIYELGELLAESARFARRARADRRRRRRRSACGWSGCATPTFNDAAAAAGHPETRFRRIGFEHQPDFADVGLTRAAPPLPLRAERSRRGSTRIATRRSTSRSRGCAKRFAATARQAHGDRRLGRARFDPRADRRGQGLRPARPAALDDPRLHHARLRHRRGDQGATPGR